MSEKIIGYTTGVFDLFHVGHLNILKKSRSMCDYLIVGVSSDALVADYKGITPFIPFEERADIIRSCRYVDEVVEQEDRDKIAAFKKFKFNVMFVGDDWKGNSLFIEVENYLEKHSARVKYLPYTKTTSSTMLRNILHKTIENK
jgi:glycerol-3-phosphate cytidylyltransferase